MKKEKIIEILKSCESKYIESDETISSAGHISRNQYERVAIKILNEEIRESGESFCLCEEPELEGTRFCYHCQKPMHPSK